MVVVNGYRMMLISNYMKRYQINLYGSERINFSACQLLWELGAWLSDNVASSTNLEFKAGAVLGNMKLL